MWRIGWKLPKKDGEKNIGCSRFYRGKDLFQILQGEKFVPDFTGGKKLSQILQGENFVPEFSKNEKIMCFLR